MYIPTKENLEGLNACKITMLDHTGKTGACIIETKGIYITYCEGTTLALGKFQRWAYHLNGFDTTFFPESLEDIQTLIRKLTPHEN